MKIKAGELKAGDTFIDGNGVEIYIHKINEKHSNDDFLTMEVIKPTTPKNVVNIGIIKKTDDVELIEKVGKKR